MRNHRRISARVFIFICLVALVSSNLLAAASNSWTQAGSLAQARAGSAAALLPDGRVLFTGGTDASGALATTEFFTPAASFSPGVSMLQARTNHTAVALRDGRVLVAGGTTIDGSFTNSAEIYDPSTNAWTSVSGGMVVARAGHTVSLLQDGHVLVAGGQSTSGATNTLEIFSPDTNTFAAVTSATLSVPRQQHAAAVLADGHVLIAGGSDGTNALNSADIFDPSSGSISPAGLMSTPRASHSVTTLLDGTVLIAGGNNGTADLASAEIYDPAAKAFSVTGNLASARSGHVAFLLPNNNEVLIAGGTSAGTAVASAELFVPWTGSFISTGALSSARVSAAGSSLNQEGQLLIAGGTDGSNALGSGELFNFATITTDASDYPPGTTVNISGSGWQPGETVNLTLVESPLYDTHGPYTAVADNSGKIFNNQFATDPNDLNIRFYLTAKGSVSQAQMTFTDSNGAANIVFGTDSPCAVTGTVSYTNNGGNQFLNVSFTTGANSASLGTQPGSKVTYSYPQTVVCSGAAYNFVSDAPSSPFTSGASGSNVTVSAHYVSATIATTLVLSNPSPSSITFGSGGPVTLSAGLTQTSGGAAVSGATVTFTVDGSSVGTAVTDGSGLATFSSYNPSALAAGSRNVQATFAQQTISGTTYSASSSGSQTLTISKATPVITWANPADITYGTPLSATQLNATASVPGTFVYSPAAATVLNAGTQTLSVTFTPTDTANYTTGNRTVQLTISKATATVTLGSLTPTYDGTAKSATATTTPVGLTVTFTYAGSATVPSNAGSYAVVATVQDNNYQGVGNGTLIIGKATATVTLGSLSPTYDGTAKSATATTTPAALTFTFTYDGSATAPTNAGSYAVVATVQDNNYQGTATGTLIIGKATATVTLGGLSPTYDGIAKSATATTTPAALTVTFTYDGSATAPTNAGSYAVVGTVQDNNYQGTGIGTLVISQATPIITWGNPAGITYGTPLSVSQLNATASVQGTLAYNPAGGAVLSAGNQTLSVTFTPTDTTNYTSATKTVSITVQQATPTITWTNPAAITYGTALSNTQLNAAASVPGTFVYSPVAGAVLNAGNQTLSVTFTPTDTTNYTNATKTVSITVQQATPTISWSNPAAITYGTALSATQLNATASVPGAFVYSPVAGAVLNAGNQTLSVTFTPTDTTNYTKAMKTVSITVQQATPTISWSNPAAIIYGTALSATQLDATASVPGTFVYSPVAGTVLSAGNNQTLSVTFTPTDSSNYTTANKTVSLTVSYGVCLLYDPTRAVKSGATYPIRLYLCNVNNVDVSSPGVVLNATALSLIGGGAGTVEDAGNANPDSNFRYDATQGPSGGYIFNLKTSGLRTGTYNLSFTAGGTSTSYSAGFGVK